MKPMTEGHLAVLRRHMVELIAMQVGLLEEELGRPALESPARGPPFQRGGAG